MWKNKKQKELEKQRQLNNNDYSNPDENKRKKYPIFIYIRGFL